MSRAARQNGRFGPVVFDALKQVPIKHHSRTLETFARPPEHGRVLDVAARGHLEVTGTNRVCSFCLVCLAALLPVLRR